MFWRLLGSGHLILLGSIESLFLHLGHGLLEEGAPHDLLLRLEDGFLDLGLHLVKRHKLVQSKYDYCRIPDAFCFTNSSIQHDRFRC